MNKLPRLHPRQQIETEAELRIRGVLHDSGLTDLEIIRVLNNVMQSPIKYALRMERHGDYNTPADVEETDDERI